LNKQGGKIGLTASDHRGKDIRADFKDGLKIKGETTRE
jgi:hypothetical protein